MTAITPLAGADVASAQQAQNLLAPSVATPLPTVYSNLYTLGPGDQLQLTFLDPSAKDVGGPFLRGTHAVHAPPNMGKNAPLQTWMGDSCFAQEAPLHYEADWRRRLNLGQLSKLSGSKAD